MFTTTTAVAQCVASFSHGLSYTHVDHTASMYPFHARLGLGASKQGEWEWTEGCGRGLNGNCSVETNKHFQPHTTSSVELGSKEAVYSPRRIPFRGTSESCVRRCPLHSSRPVDGATRHEQGGIVLVKFHILFILTFSTNSKTHNSQTTATATNAIVTGCQEGEHTDAEALRG